MLVRISRGEIFFDEFNTEMLDPKWTLIPNDSLRYSMTELSDYLKMFHGTPDFMMLIDEPGTKYIMDIKNNYIPLNESLQAGIVVFRELNNSLEILEYYDVTKDESYVYEYMRIVRDGTTYTVYAKNTITVPWELVASVQYEGSGKIGLIVKGPNIPGASEFEVDFVRIYESQEVSIVNLPIGYKVEAYREDGFLVDARRVVNEHNGVSFTFDDTPPVKMQFKIYKENDELVDETTLLQVCGGDVFFFGAFFHVSIDGKNLYQDIEHMLGHFKNSIIDFQVTITNPSDINFTGVSISAMQYADNDGYKYVKFQDERDGEYKTEVVIGDVNSLQTVVVNGRISRSSEMIGVDYNPYKFNIRLTTD